MSHSSQVVVMYGGTFDPFHIGHEAICRAILAKDAVTELRILPCHVPALKLAASATSVDRLSMLRVWCDEQAAGDRLVIDDRELQRIGTTYTVDTVKELAKLFPNAKLVFALGADAWNTLDDWKDSKVLIELVSFWVFSRQGERPAVEKSRLPVVSGVAELADAGAGHSFFDSRVIPEVASSAMRQVQDFEKWPVPAVVRQYIINHALYQWSSAHSEGFNDRYTI